MKKPTLAILIKTLMPSALLPAFLETVAVLCRGVWWSFLSKEMLETLLMRDRHRLSMTALLMFAALSLGTLAAAVSKRVRVHLSGRATMAMEDAVLERYARAENRRAYSGETILGHLSDVAAKASGETLEYALNLYQTALSILTTAVYAWILNPYILLIILLITFIAGLIMRKDTDKLPALYEKILWTPARSGCQAVGAGEKSRSGVHAEPESGQKGL